MRTVKTADQVESYVQDVEFGFVVEENDENSDSERAAQMIQRFLSGETLRSIGESFNVSRQRIQQILKGHGIGRGDRKEFAKELTDDR